MQLLADVVVALVEHLYYLDTFSRVRVLLQHYRVAEGPVLPILCVEEWVEGWSGLFHFRARFGVHRECGLGI